MRSSIFIKPMTRAAKTRALFAIFAARAVSRLLRLLGRGATALPGKVALTLDPRLLSKLTGGRRVFLVTGTNGKTTTVRMLCTLLEEQGFSVITNPSGANLDSGLTTTIIENRGCLRQSDDAANKTGLAMVFEIDEAFFGKLAALIQPEVSIVTNFFRDQLDRFGELRHTRDLIARGLSESGTQAVLCADDSLCASLGKDRTSRTFYFGMDPEGMMLEPKDTVLESPYCTFCGTRYHYDRIAYGHLGLFSCPNCGFSRPRPDLSFKALEQKEQSLVLQVTAQGVTAQAEIPVPGLHNAYNAAAALTAGVAAGLPLEPSVHALKKVVAAFGRMERFVIDKKAVCLILVKNPIGLERALDFVNRANDVGGVMMLLNAQEADGRDVSWIWDVYMENHLPAGIIGVSGERCHDLALRLYYAGKPGEAIKTDPDHLALFDSLLETCPPNRCLYLLPNYTALLAIRADLAKRYKLRAFWQ